jgi:hypothetical protein
MLTEREGHAYSGLHPCPGLEQHLTFTPVTMIQNCPGPQINGYLAGLHKSQKFVIENRTVFERAATRP